MDYHPLTDSPPFRLLDLPKELRDDIYEAAVFDLSPPDMFIIPEYPESLRLREMNTNILLTNRQVYWEVRDVIMRRGQLIIISMPHVQLGRFDPILKALSGITGIDPTYRNLCIMSHRLCHAELDLPPNRPRSVWEFILHRQDTEFFCRLLMGEFGFWVGQHWGWDITHILNLHCSSIYGRNEFNDVYAIQNLVLQKYRNILGGFGDFEIRGASIGWENGLYGAVLQDIRSVDDREPTDLMDDIRTLERKGSQILLQTGDVEAADVFWVKALGKCEVAYWSFRHSNEPQAFQRHYYSETFHLHVERWVALRRQNGNECATPLQEVWWRLISRRLSGALRFIEQGHHLATRHGRAPRPNSEYSEFVWTCKSARRHLYRDFYDFHRWTPQPSDEAQFCLTVAAIYRLLDTTNKARRAYRAVRRAAELVPDDETIQQEKERVETWISRLVDNGTLDSFPEPWP